MQNKRRETILKVAVAVAAGLFVLDRFVLSPAISSWKEQSERIAALREKVERGRQLVDRETSVRARWATMLETDLPEDRATAESEVFAAISRWAGASRVSFSNLSPDWRAHEAEGYETYECRASALGDQASLARLIYEMETDPLPAHLQECELTTRDAKGTQIMLTVRFDFVRLAGNGKETP